MKTAKTIGIIGAGVSGLVTAKTMREHGFSVIIFEKEAELGGVWASTRRYPNVTTQNTRDTYTFSDFPMPKHYAEWPTGEQIQEYLTNYARQFAILPFVRFSTTVERAEPVEGGQDGWVVYTTQNGKSSRLMVDFLVVCNGVFSEPNRPQVPGRALFAGTVLHSTEFRAGHLEAAKQQKVVVVGFAKSAHDILSQVSDVSHKPVCIYREAKWKMPRIFWGLNFKYLLLHRFGESLFPYRTLYGIHKFLHGPLGKPVTGLLTKGIGKLIAAQLELKKSGLLPEKPFESIANCSIGLTSDHFYERALSGDIQLEKGEIAAFDTDGVVLTNGKKITADTVVFATGFQQTVPFFAPEISRRLRNQKGWFQLYRNVLPLGVSNLSFVGYNPSLFTPFTSELAAHYTAQYIKGELNLPSPEAMKAEIIRHQEWLVNRAPKSHSSGTCVIPFSFHHADELMRDMGLRTRRTWNPIKEFMVPFNPGIYKGLTQELSQLSSQPSVLPGQHVVPVKTNLAQPAGN
ncbi:flavin-containing monooxygenase [Spirosoma fluviale]|uniref:Predicted flavoprotein CzcO associated with the cation diffusion facilitator CzcD n=1 Tax=Spirosoma fluviale TaxID=1597977 RepID=A0A286GB49_9BACT|nr:NAD(P)-binding domain-containing protein [Spirosoma fluviale]SOD92234.1 Predicted flavoprotein CzcO associated with the cation diffusion facilitator CzcD [Spirosoma fluviale]